MALTPGPLIPDIVPGSSVALQQVAVDYSTSGHHAVIAGVAGKSIYVVSYTLVGYGAVNVTFNDFDGASTYVALTGAMPIAGLGSPNTKATGRGAHFWTTTVGHGIDLNLSGSVQVCGWINYVQV